MINLASGYVRGFLTAYNWNNPKEAVVRDMPDATIGLYIQKYCRENPLADAGMASFELVKDMGGNTRPKR